MIANAPQDKPWIVVVGGFLGAGKTTLILAAARMLETRGQRSAIILNDQGSGLVDRELAMQHDVRSGEVTGGCFCCRLSDLLDVADRLRAFAPHVIFTEPVGSCTDIVATVMRPLQELHHTYRIAPFTVLVDPGRAVALQQDCSDPRLRFLFEKQLDEADLLCWTKSDLYPAGPALPGRSMRQISAVTGQGVTAWLHEVLSGEVAVGQRTLHLDYAQYAQAEAALAWLNFRARFFASAPISPAMLLGPLLDQIDECLSAEGIAIMHLKGVARCNTGFVKAALCANGDEPKLEGDLGASPAVEHEILLNLRAVGAPDHVRGLIERCLARLDGSLQEQALDCFSPAAPVPQRRIVQSIQSGDRSDECREQRAWLTQ